MSKGRRVTGSKLLGDDLRRRRGHRSLEEIARLSKSAPFSSRVEPIAYSTLSMLERGLTMPSAQSLLTLSVLYQVPSEHFLDLIALERYHQKARTGVADIEALELELIDDIKASRFADAYTKTLSLRDALEGGGEPRGGDDAARAARTRVYCGIALWNLGWLAQASNTFREVVDDLAIDGKLRGWAYQNLVEVERARGCLASAHAFARDGLELAVEVGTERLQATFHATLANLKSDLAERATETAMFTKLVADSLRHHGKAQEMARGCADDFLLAHDLINEGATLSVAGSRKPARKRIQEGLDLARQHGYGRLVAYGWLETGKLDLAEGKPQAARESLWRSEREAAAVDANDILFMDYFYLMRVAEELGDDTQHAYRKCLSLKSFQQGRFRELEEFEALQLKGEAAS